ncbi:MAG: hypothetical protein PHI97_12780 [Desulfobulbus sp.]|nr:hypothetical protein [Desulfobulbus sp.]
MHAGVFNKQVATKRKNIFYVNQGKFIMKQKTVILISLIGTLSLPTWFAVAADQSSGQEISGIQGQQVYGSQLMTQDERVDYRRQMRDAKTAEEREELRTKHHQRMQERAQVRGLTLPEDPPGRGGGMGMGHGGGRMMNGGNGNR